MTFPCDLCDLRLKMLIGDNQCRKCPARMIGKLVIIQFDHYEKNEWESKEAVVWSIIEINSRIKFGELLIITKPCLEFEVGYIGPIGCKGITCVI